MFRLAVITFFLGLLAPVMAPAQEPDFTLSSPAALQESGFLRFLVPRFSLKTHIRPALEIDSTAAEATLNTEGDTPVMHGLGQTYYLLLGTADTARQQKAQRFAEWLLSDIGRRTIEQFAPNGAPLFTAAEPEQVLESAVVFLGDIGRGEALSHTHCGRCHVVSARNRMKGIDSTPSFALLRGLPDWDERFQTFYVRIPHPAITQIDGVTAPFDPAYPPNAYPLRLSTKQLEDILTFVSTIEPADLGAPLVVH